MARKKKKAPLGCLFWIACILLVIVVFLLNRETINNVLESTGLIEILTPKEDRKPLNFRFTRNDEESDSIPNETPEENPVITEPVTTVVEEETPEPESVTEETSDDSNTRISIEVPVPEEEEVEDHQQEEENPEMEDMKLRRSRLYYIEINDETSSLKSVTRPVRYTDAPLTATLQSLISGPSANELNMGMISLIPEGTALRGIKITDQTAFIDFSDNFRYNTFGVEGYKYQLMQIVYTATEFSTVKNVQFTIEGENYEYIGPEGVYIGSPISRADFQ